MRDGPTRRTFLEVAGASVGLAGPALSAQATTAEAQRGGRPKVAALSARPDVALTIDGGDPRYLDDALARGLMPTLGRIVSAGAYPR